MVCEESKRNPAWVMLMHGGQGSPAHHQGAKCMSLSVVLKSMEVRDGMIRLLYCVFNEGHRGWESIRLDLGSWSLI